MNKDRMLGFLVALFLSAVTLVAYIQHEKYTVRMNGETFQLIGMVIQQNGQETLYIPAYRRMNK